uniref:Arachidonate--CoA ligase n=1 Tax=Leptobrachium leishanense TaxID=445787 RepID=A0A8C5LNQ4_9ANUR
MQSHDIFRSLRIPELVDVRQYVRTLPTNTLMGFGAFAALTTYWYATRPKALKPPCDLAMQSVEVQGGDGAKRSALLDSDEVMTYYYDDVRTLYEVFQRGTKVSNNGPCLGHRKPNQPYQWISYQEVSDRAEYLGSALLHRGFKPSSEQFVGIFAQNRPEVKVLLIYQTFILCPLCLACAVTLLIVPADISLVFCDTPEKAKLLLTNVEKNETPVLKTIVLMEPFDEDLLERGKKSGVELVSLKEMEVCANLRKRIDTFALVKQRKPSFRNPKGAKLTHKNIVSNSAGFLKVTECVVLCHGARIGYFQGDIRLLMDDLKALQPTIFPVVPRLLNRMFDRIFGQANTPVKRWMLEFASKRKEAELRSGIIRNDSFWDKIIFRKVQASLGGKVRLMITGAAPVSPTVLTFLRAALGCQFYEGYGQTECTAGCSLTIPGDWSAGHVGAPMPCNHMKLVDVEEMNYFAANGEGEVCVKGSNVFQGYLKDDEKTAEALDKDGWLHTGDVGKWLPNGTLKIIDRKKHIFKLAQGEYIAPEKIENVYTRSEPVVQVFVHGESLQAFLVGIVVPDPDNVLNWAKKKKFGGSYEELCKNKDFKNAVLEDLLKLGKDTGLKSFEQVKDIVLHPELFSIENGLLTPTLKAKRPELRKYFQAQIDELYGHLVS